jgi:hypothetical protein
MSGRPKRAPKRRCILDPSDDKKGGKKGCYYDKPVFEDNIERGKDDEMVRLGRKEWGVARKFPGDRRFFTFCPSEKDGVDDWCFAPKYLGSAIAIKKYGYPGIHYAVGYKQLGEMVTDYGSLISCRLPPLPLAGRNFATEEQREQPLPVASVAPSVLPSSSASAAPSVLLLPVASTPDVLRSPSDHRVTTPRNRTPRNRTPHNRAVPAANVAPAVTPGTMPRSSNIGRIKALEHDQFGDGYTAPQSNLHRILSLEKCVFGDTFVLPDNSNQRSRIEALEREAGLE